MREIVLDTETTGFDPSSGDRIVEIGAVELINHLPSGETYQAYINPQRDMPEEAFSVHGLSAEFLADKPVFADVADGFLEFVGDADLIIHNAEFDMKFLKFEYGLLDFPALVENGVIDTLGIARRKFPGSPANLDALCRRFQIDISDRSLHGALKDARLLSEVYLELIGGRQTGLALARAAQDPAATGATARNERAARPHAPSAEENAQHAAFLKKMKNPLWPT